MTTAVWVAISAAVLAGALTVVVVQQWLIYERERRIARTRWGASQDTLTVRAERRDFTALEQALQARADQILALRRENVVAWQRVGELSDQLQASRDLARQQERDRLALVTARIEEDTGRHDAVPALPAGPTSIDPQALIATNVVPILRIAAPTAELPIQKAT